MMALKNRKKNCVIMPLQHNCAKAAKVTRNKKVFFQNNVKSISEVKDKKAGLSNCNIIMLVQSVTLL